MAEALDDNGSLESTTVGIYRTAATVKGGRRFSFAALVVVGDRQGRVGIGYAKAGQVPSAIEKSQKEGKRKLNSYPMQDRTVPHLVEGRFGACRVRLVPASPGTGVIAGASVRAILEMLGIQDCLTKCYGSTNPKNLVKATLDALSQLRLRTTVEALRGVELGVKLSHAPSAGQRALHRGRALLALGLEELLRGHRAANFFRRRDLERRRRREVRLRGREAQRRLVLGRIGRRPLESLGGCRVPGGHRAHAPGSDARAFGKHGRSVAGRGFSLVTNFKPDFLVLPATAAGF